MMLLADATLEEFLKSTRESVGAGPSQGMTLALALVAAVLLLLLAILHRRQRAEAVPKSVNHQGRLLKQATRSLGLKADEVRELSKAAEEQEISSPLVLLICPSALARTIGQRRGREREMLIQMVKRMEQKQR